MARIQITVCDRCGSLERLVTQYDVTHANRTVTVDLCSEHGLPLDAIMNLVADAPLREAAAETNVTTLEDHRRRPDGK
ncbi:hypothetical protein [Sanguibacter antarcticus]|uniref:Uncharacterized protein n=1 Tax=Sanguibacter antarcticus TaxID=372484 RepID=A0A2A9E3D4_9MICO|nr:hypothetical protein [Sanguibacter antarcticus]PFG33344.1 hypothetical protein ATL42_1214 [Sanguibacter antarcticus]